MRFRGIVELNGKTATGVEVPAEVVEGLGSGRKPKVLVTIGGHTYRSSVASMGGRFLIPVSAENRERCGVAAGDEVEVGLALDTGERTVEVPPDFAAALDANPEARTFFDGLSYSKRSWHVLSVTGAKTQETRARRIAKSVTLLANHQTR